LLFVCDEEQSFETLTAGFNVLKISLSALSTVKTSLLHALTTCLKYFGLFVSEEEKEFFDIDTMVITVGLPAC
jgi:hypothetical protein